MSKEIYGYIRVSTKEQNVDRQCIAMQEFGVPEDHVYIDKQSGNSSAVYTDATVKEFLDEYQYLRCITTNYPSWLLQKTKGL